MSGGRLATHNYVLPPGVRETLVAIDPRVGDLYAVFDRHNERFFEAALPDLPLLVVQVFAYGHCIGQTRISHQHVPVIEVGQRQWSEGPDDVLLHEMLHAYLFLRGENTAHNAPPWCREVERITPLYLGFEVKATPQRVKRIDGKPTRWTPEGHLTRQELGAWPHSVRC